MLQPGRAMGKGPGKGSLRGEKRKKYFCFLEQSFKEHHRAGMTGSTFQTMHYCAVGSSICCGDQVCK